MRSEDIMWFEITFGDRPIVTVKCNGRMMKVKYLINGSRDGWMSFPEGYFDEKTIVLTDEDKSRLRDCLLSLDFALFKTSRDLFRNFGAVGFCISKKFICRFSDGKAFECLFPDYDGFNRLVEIVKSIVGINDAAPACSQFRHNSNETGWICVKCGTSNQFSCAFCENCGSNRPW